MADAFLMQLNEAYLFRLESPTPAYLWSGVGDIIAPDGDTYWGMGELSGLPAVQQLINGVAQRIEVTLSGVTAHTVALATEEAAEVKGSRVVILTMPMDERQQPTGSLDVEWEGVADVVSVDRSSSPDGSGVRSISLSIGSADTARSRADPTNFTDADQRRRSPDDAFCSHVGGISAGTSRRFGTRGS